ncbi:cation diffusion facilitator family transporter [Algiphilus sp.]|uniref:cation diffusion facilitator family transporter n=1 Tax=Algiphilus sp. TaxID=1872431 RepID=UPI003B517249
MSHTTPHHDHGHHHHHAPASTTTLLWALALTLGFAAVEAVGGWLSGSLALMSDAGHMVSDGFSLAIGAFAAWLARRPASARHSFGLQRAEVIGALVNALLMTVVVVAVAFAAIQRLLAPAPVAGATVMLIAFVGLLVNLLVAWILMRGEQTINVRGALLHVMGDLLASVAALTAGAVIYFTGWTPIDPLLSLFVAGLILLSASRLLREALQVLMEGVPRGIRADEVGKAMTTVPGVRAVHDLHIWSLSSTTYALAAHVDLHALDDWQRLLPELQAMLAERFGITHSTLQPEDTAMTRACAVDGACGAHR